MEFDAISKVVCAEKGVKFVSANCRRMHERVSVLSFVNAAGACVIRNLLIFSSPSGRLPTGVTDGADKDVMFRDKLVYEKTAYKVKVTCVDTICFQSYRKDQRKKK